MITTNLGKAQVNPFNGAMSYSIPLALTPARGLEPQLVLTYHPSSHNSMVGMGWDLSVNVIERSTQFFIPSYNNTNDIFNSPWGELVALAPSLTSLAPSLFGNTTAEWNVQAYQPRLENDFFQIEFWERKDGQQSYWLVKTNNGVNHLFGLSEEAKIIDPDFPQHIFQWSIEKTWDAKGNKIVYLYEKPENAVNHYIQSISYGNYFKDNDEKFAFTVLFDYSTRGLSDSVDNPLTIVPAAATREDIFLSYASGFCIETTRLCKNILLLHEFSELSNPSPFLVKGWEFTYQPTEHSRSMQLTSFVQHGYKRLKSDKYLHNALPPLLFSYHRWAPELIFKSDETIIFPVDEALPGNLQPFRFVDLYQEGLPGILYSDTTTTLYWRNRGNAQFDAPILVSSFPIDRSLNSRRCQLMVFPDNDQMGLVVGDRNYGGFYGSLDENGWSQFQAFENYTIDFIQPEAQFADIEGRGYSDLVILMKKNSYYYPSMSKQGFAAAKSMILPDDFPLNQFSANIEFITFANIVGDGLSHRVRVRQNSVEYWPNLGYGRFGNKISLSNPPDFGDDFDARCIFLADVSGKGSVDIIYVSSTHVSIYMNLQGHAFASTPVNITLPDLYTHHDQIRFVDLLGKGASCLVFTKITAQAPVHYYYDFSTTQYPYLLKNIQDNVGLSTTLGYTCSVACYIEDKNNQAISDYIPRYKCLRSIHVVDRMVQKDNITQITLTERFRFHDGCYNPIERSFSGFGFVEHWDCEEVSKTLDSPPRYTKTWYHLGMRPSETNPTYLKDKQKNNFYTGDADAWLLNTKTILKTSDQSLPEDTPLTIEDSRQARYSLRGQIKREEVYAINEASLLLYTISSYNFTLRCLKKPNFSKGIFSVLHRESLVYNYEGESNDPRITHHLLLEWDDFNHIQKSCTIYYPRRQPSTQAATESDQPLYAAACQQVHQEQTKVRMIATQRSVVSQLFSQDKQFQFLGFPQESLVFEISRPEEEYPTTLYLFSDILKFYNVSIKDENTFLHRKRYYYWDNIQQNAIFFDSTTIIKELPLLHHTEAWVDKIATLQQHYPQLAESDFSSTLLEETGYLLYEASWWKPSDISFYDKSMFYLMYKTEGMSTNSDLFTRNEIAYDAPYFFIPTQHTRFLYDHQSKVLKPIVLLTVKEIDYNVCKASQSFDDNNVVSEVLYDSLGEVVASSRYGTLNNTIVGNEPLDESMLMLLLTPLRSVLDNPSQYLQGAAHVTVYQLYNPAFPEQPTCQLHIIAEQFQRSPVDLLKNIPDFNPAKIQIYVNYYDSFSKVVQAKTKADNDVWTVSGYMIYNNKGLLIKKYLPYYASKFEYEDQEEKIEQLPPPEIYFYDALDRLTRINTPKGFHITSEWSAWYLRHFDENNNLLDSAYYLGLPENSDEKKALDSLQFYKDAPKITLLDSLSHAFLEIRVEKKSDGNARLLSTVTTYDALGRKLTLQDPRLTQPNIIFTYDKLGNILIENSVDSGKKTQLYNCFGNVMQQWTSRGYVFQWRYDNWQRVLKKSVRSEIDNNDTFHVYEALTYGESIAPDTPNYNNCSGQIIEHRDQLGINKFSNFDIQGHSLSMERTIYLLVQNNNVVSMIDWGDTTFVLPPPDRPFSHQAYFDALGKMIQYRQPDNSLFLFSYNQLEQLQTILLQISGSAPVLIVKNVTYLANGQKDTVEYGNDMKTNFQYEATTQQLIALITDHPSKDPALCLQSVTYHHDPVGNIIDMCDRSYETLLNHSTASSFSKTSTSSLQYDSLYRLQSASSRAPGAAFFKKPYIPIEDVQKKPIENVLETMSEKFEYDSANNLVHSTSQKADIISENQLAVSTTSNRLNDFACDAQGNMLSLESGTTLTWDYLNQLIQFQRKNTQDQVLVNEYYFYAASKYRTRKLTILYDANNVISSITEVLYFSSYQLTRQRDPKTANFPILENSDSIALRLHDGKRCIATYRYGAEISGDPLTYHLGNHLRSVAVEVDSQANFLTYEEFSAYGLSNFFVCANKDAAAHKTYRYSKEEFDVTTELYYYGARYYSPKLARWLSPDPAGLIDGLNVYGFVSGNPINFWDYWGYGLPKRIRAVFDRSRKMFVENVKEKIALTRAGNVSAKATIKEMIQLLTDKDKAAKKLEAARVRRDNTDEGLQTAALDRTIAFAVSHGPSALVTDGGSTKTITYIDVQQHAVFPTKTQMYKDGMGHAGVFVGNANTTGSADIHADRTDAFLGGQNPTQGLMKGVLKDIEQTATAADIDNNATSGITRLAGDLANPVLHQQYKNKYLKVRDAKKVLLGVVATKNPAAAAAANVDIANLTPLVSGLSVSAHTLTPNKIASAARELPEMAELVL